MNTFITNAKLNKEPKQMDGGSYLLNFTGYKFRKNDEFIFCSGFITENEYKFLKDKLVVGNTFEILGAIEKIDMSGLNSEFKSISLQLSIFKVRFLYEKSTKDVNNITNRDVHNRNDTIKKTPIDEAKVADMLKNLSPSQLEALRAQYNSHK